MVFCLPIEIIISLQIMLDCIGNGYFIGMAMNMKKLFPNSNPLIILHTKPSQYLLNFRNLSYIHLIYI